MKIILLSVFCGAGVAWSGPIFTVTDLGSLGGSAAQAYGLNASGVAVGSATNAFGYSHAFSSLGSAMTDLTFNTGASEGIASAVNSSGTIAGTQYVNGQAYATEWINGSPVSIGAAGSFAMAINDAGQITGMASDGHAFAGSSELNAFSWSSGYGINSSGTVAGYAQVAPGVFRAIIWTPSTGYVVLGTLGGSNSYAMAINDAGQVAGNAQLGSGYSHAFLYSNGVMQDLGTLGGSSFAYGVNASGDVVGYSYTNGAARAFLFENGIMIDLNSLIDPASGWMLTQAYAINGSNQIVGSGLLNGVEHAFRLDYAAGYTDVPALSAAASVAAPEPSSWILAAIGLGLILSSRIRFRAERAPHPTDPSHEPRK